VASDATIFGFAQNKANPSDVPVSAVLSPDVPRSCCDRNQSIRVPKKIQAICNGKSTPSAM
jgi:hypothetical protein